MKSKLDAADDGVSVNDHSPNLSVIVPAHDCATELRQCLEALAASSLPREHWELIVVDDGSHDETGIIAARHANLVVRLPGEPLGPDYARNRGVEVSRGPVLVFVSADVCVREDALQAFRQALADPEIGAVSGTYEYARREDALTDFQALYSQFVRDRAAGDVDTFFAGLGAIRRSVLTRAGGFDEWCENRPRVAAVELGQRIRALGYRVVLDAKVRGVHLKRRALATMLQQTLRDHGTPYEEGPMPRAEVVNPGLRWVRGRERISPVLCWVAADAAALTMLVRHAEPLWWAAFGCLALAVLLNVPFYRFAARRRGALYLAAALPMHLGGSMLVGMSRSVDRLARWIIGEPRPAPAVEALGEVGLKTWPPVPMRRAPLALGSADD